MGRREAKSKTEDIEATERVPGWPTPGLKAPNNLPSSGYIQNTRERRRERKKRDIDRK